MKDPVGVKKKKKRKPTKKRVAVAAQMKELQAMPFNLQQEVDAAIAEAVTAATTSKDTQIATLQAEKTAIQSNLDACTTTIASKDATIGQLEDDLAACEAGTTPPPPPPPANALPWVVNDTASVVAGTTVSGNVLTNDTDADGDPLTVSASSGPITIATNGAWSFNSGTAGTYISNYTISDGKGGTDSGKLTVTVTAATTTPPPPPPPTTTGFPNASNTGPADGTVFVNKSGVYQVWQQDGAVIENLHVTGSIEIHSNNVTMRNCKLSSTTMWHGVRVFDAYSGFKMENCEIDGRGTTVNGIYGKGIFLKNDIYGIDNGINIVGPTTFQDNYVHDFKGSSQAHYDGVEVNGGGGHDIKIIHNNIVVNATQTAAIMLNNEFGGLKNITVDNNRLVGGGYTCYLDGRKGGGVVDDATIKFTNNRVGKGYWGYWAFYDDNPVRIGNVDDVTGQPV